MGLDISGVVGVNRLSSSVVEKSANLNMTLKIMKSVSLAFMT